jgi:hypothetical protein
MRVLGGGSVLSSKLHHHITSTVMRQVGLGEPVCFRVFVDAQEWLEENNRYT